MGWGGPPRWPHTKAEFTEEKPGEWHCKLMTRLVTGEQVSATGIGTTKPNAMMSARRIIKDKVKAAEKEAAARLARQAAERAKRRKK